MKIEIISLWSIEFDKEFSKHLFSSKEFSLKGFVCEEGTLCEVLLRTLWGTCQRTGNL